MSNINWKRQAQGQHNWREQQCREERAREAELLRRREALALALFGAACEELRHVEPGEAMRFDQADFPGAMRLANRLLDKARARLSGQEARP